jgi:hypothetical protein
VPAASGSGTYSNGGDFEVEIDSGDTFTAPAIEVTDVDGSTRASLPNIGVVCEWKQITAEATDGFDVPGWELNAYPSGGVHVIGDFRVNDADGVFGEVPARERIQIQNARIDTAASVASVIVIAVEVNVPVVNSAGDGVGGNVTNLLNPHGLPDVTLDDDDGAVASYPMPTAIVIDGEVDSAAYSSGTLTIVPAGGSVSGLIYQRSSFRGVPSPYSDYDLRWQIDNGTYDYGNPTGTRVSLDFTNANPFYHVTPNNAFGNNKRFTDSQGNAAPDGLAGFSAIDWAVDRPGAIPFYVIDHLTGLGWIVVKIGFQENWDVALSTANGLSHGGFSDYRVASTGEIEDVLNTAIVIEFYGSGNIFYRNNNFATGTETSLWLNSTNVITTSQANILNNSGDISRAAKTATTARATYAVRTHYT